MARCSANQGLQRNRSTADGGAVAPGAMSGLQERMVQNVAVLTAGDFEDEALVRRPVAGSSRHRHNDASTPQRWVSPAALWLGFWWRCRARLPNVSRLLLKCLMTARLLVAGSTKPFLLTKNIGEGRYWLFSVMCKSSVLRIVHRPGEAALRRLLASRAIEG